MSAVFAEREISVANGTQGFVRVYQPEQDDLCWVCRLHFAWNGAERQQSIYGEDGFQALMLAIQIVPNFIETSDAHKAGTLKVFDRVLSDRDPQDADNRTFLEQFFSVKTFTGSVQ
jgi:hypothetical protein